MRILLQIVDGQNAGRRTLLPVPGRLQIGRTEYAEFVVEADKLMSSVHFQLESNLLECRLRDLGSTNGTFLNGARITESIVKDGDTILAGATSFEVGIEQRSSQTALKTPPITPPPDMPKRKPPMSMQQTVVLDEFPRKSVRSNQGFSAEQGNTICIDYHQETGAFLEVASGTDAGRKSILRSGQSVTVGRTENSEFVISDPQMSSIHFVVKQTQTGWQLSDQDSKAGTLLNGLRVNTESLSSGDAIVAGNTGFFFHTGKVAAAEAEPTPKSGAPFREALSDPDADVRREAVQAAACARQPWLLDLCSEMAGAPTLEHFDLLYALAVLGKPSDLPTVLKLGKCEVLAHRRFDILGAFGHPKVVAALLEGMESTDERAAIAAALAFEKITGINLESDQRVTLPPEDTSDPDEFEQEFLEDGLLPDTELANTYWQERKSQYNQGIRWRRGFDVSDGATEEVFDQLDMQSRFEARLRDKFYGTWNGRIQDLERFPIGTKS